MHPCLKPIFPNGKAGKSTFSPAVLVGEFLHISGMTAVDENRNLIGPGDIAVQARYIYQKMAKVLAAANGGLDCIVQTTDYVTTFDGYDKTADVRKEVFGAGPFPAATGVQVAGLVRPGALIEISAVAYLGRGLPKSDQTSSNAL